MRSLTLAVVVSLGAGPSARAQEGPPDGGSPAALLCTSSETCADREGRGSVCEEGSCRRYKDRTDLFLLVGLKKQSAAPPEPFKPLLAVFPVVAYNPAQGVLFGVSTVLGIYLGDPRTTTISSISANLHYTTKNQLLTAIQSVLMLGDNSWELQGDWRFLLTNQNTFGLGTGPTPVSGGFTLNGYGTTAGVEGAQPMDFNLIRIRENFLKRVTGTFYIGPGFNFDRYYAIRDLSLNLEATPPAVTSHYGYSKALGFNPAAYNISGPTLGVLWDSRDSTINAYRGLYAALTYQWYPTWLGSASDSSLLVGDFRGYVGLSKSVPRNVLAFWFVFQSTLGGHLPYLGLPAIGWDFRNKTGRGYVQGRFRGTAEIYAEAEWRFRITENGLLGGVLFANVETFSRPPLSYQGVITDGEDLFQNLRPSGGVGLRIMMNRQSRANITVDLTVAEKTFGLYFGCGEAF